MTHGKGRERASGFSLVELLIAIGILGTASLLIGTAFLAGSLEHKRSVNDTMGTIVAENARSICATALSYHHLMGYWQHLGAGFDSGRFQNVTPLLARLDRTYPTVHSRAISDAEYSLPVDVVSFQLLSTEPDVFDFVTNTCYGQPKDWIEAPPGGGRFVPRSRYGWLALLKHRFPKDWKPAQGLPRFCDLRILVYRKHLEQSNPETDLVFFNAHVSVKRDNDNIPISARIHAPAVDVGAPVVLHANGSHALTVDDEGQLDHPIWPAGPAVSLEYIKGTESPIITVFHGGILLDE